MVVDGYVDVRIVLLWVCGFMDIAMLNRHTDMSVYIYIHRHVDV